MQYFWSDLKYTALHKSSGPLENSRIFSNFDVPL